MNGKYISVSTSIVVGIWSVRFSSTHYYYDKNYSAIHSKVGCWKSLQLARPVCVKTYISYHKPNVSLDPYLNLVTLESVQPYSETCRNIKRYPFPVPNVSPRLCSTFNQLIFDPLNYFVSIFFRKISNDWKNHLHTATDEDRMVRYSVRESLWKNH